MKSAPIAFTSATLAVLATSPAAARSDSQLWTTAGVTVKISDQWRVSEDVVARFSDNRSGLYEVEAATLVGYRLNKNATIAAGYVHHPQ